jgi:hypothetical protein
MKSLKWWVIVVAVVLLLGSVAAMGAAPIDNSGKVSMDKVVFAEYSKGNSHNPGVGSISRGGVLSPDYQYSGIHWANPTAITYYVNPTNSGVTSNTTITALDAAFATWDNACGPLRYIDGGTTTATAGALDGKNVVSWANISAQYPNAIAVTTVWYYRYTKTIAEVDTQMNSAFPWSYTLPNITHDLSGPAIADATRYSDPTDSGISGTYDIQDIMTHEAGHWIMLGDLYSSRDSLLTMYGYGVTGELTKDTLGYGDELGVERVYGS